MHREHDGRVLGTDSEPRRTGFRTPCWPRAGFDQIGAIQASREPFPDLSSEAMMIRPVSRDECIPGFPLPRLTDVLQPGDHLVSAWPPGQTPV